MKAKRIVSGLAIGGALSLSACAKEVATPPPPEVVAVERQDSPERLERANAVTVTAAVTDVDLEHRLVTLKGPDGKEQVVRVGPEVRNLPQVKKGDHVVVTYLESVVFELFKRGEVEPGGSVGEMAERAPLGERPGALAAETVTFTGTVTAVDKKKPSLTLRAANGEVVTLPVRDAKKLDPVKVGDLLQITYDRALAIAVEKP